MLTGPKIYQKHHSINVSYVVVDVQSDLDVNNGQLTVDLTSKEDTFAKGYGLAFSNGTLSVSGKQDTLGAANAGSNIDITNGVISASNFISSVNPAILSVTNGVLDVDLTGLQTTLTPGSNISILNGVISSPGGSGLVQSVDAPLALSSSGVLSVGHTFTPQSPLQMSATDVLSVDLSGKQDTLGSANAGTLAFQVELSEHQTSFAVSTLLISR